MDEEKVLDMQGVATDAKAAEQETQDAQKNEEIGCYTHDLKQPFRWKEQTFESLTFDWTTLTGRDYLDIEHEMMQKGRTLVTPEFTGDFLAGMAARACTARDEKG